MGLRRFFQRLRDLLQDLLGERMAVRDDMAVVLVKDNRTRRVK